MRLRISAALCLVVFFLFRVPEACASSFPVRALTHPPGYHWFGYYDKFQFDPTDRYVLGMQVSFEHRSPKPEDTVKIGMVDLQEDDKWIELGKSRAWCWQQGCMLQWLPGSRDTILWNDREGDRFVCRVLNVFTGKLRTIAYPIYTVSPNGRWALSVDFRRINRLRPGYGYAGPPDPYEKDPAPKNSGIYLVDLKSGSAKLIVSIARAAAIPSKQNTKGATHYFNHLLFNPTGDRFVFLHRWRLPGKRGFLTRMLTSDLTGSDIRVIDDNGGMSHFIWRDSKHILGWAHLPNRGWGFFLFPDGPGPVVQIGKGILTKNGHVSYLPDKNWLLNDTYPQGKKREQIVYLYHIPTKRKIILGRFPSPPAYRGEWRCDTHPRINRKGTAACIDSPHGGNGRQMYLIDIRQAIGIKEPIGAKEAIDTREALKR